MKETSKIHHAAQTNNVRKIAAANAESINTQDDNGKTPLLLAIENGHHQAVSQLVRSGAEIDIADDNGVTPVLLAAYYADTRSLAHLMPNRKEHSYRLAQTDNAQNSLLHYLNSQTIEGYKNCDEKMNPEVNTYTTPLTLSEREFGAIRSCPSLTERKVVIEQLYHQSLTIEEKKRLSEMLNHTQEEVKPKRTKFSDMLKSIAGSDSNIHASNEEKSSRDNRSRSSTFPGDEPSTSPKPTAKSGRERRFSFTSDKKIHIGS